MNQELLTQIMEQATLLSLQEKHQLAEFLAQQLALDKAAARSGRQVAAAELSPEKLKWELRMSWIKAHRAEYAGGYVALDGDRLVGAGKTYKEASLAAKQNGVMNAFITQLSAEDEAPFGGW